MIKKLSSFFWKFRSEMKKTSHKVGELVEYHALVRRLILVFLSIFLYVFIKVTISMYTSTGSVDSSFEHIVISFFGMYGAFISFYTMSRKNSPKESQDDESYNNNMIVENNKESGEIYE